MIKVCLDCNKEFKENPNDKRRVCYQCIYIKSKVPCEKCGLPRKRRAKICKNCYVNPGLSGEKNGRWTGGRITDKQGYIHISASNHPKKSARGYVREHILVMEEMLGRYLEPGENVHHINGVKGDNRPENLELWIRPQPTGIRAKDAVVWAKEILEKYSDFA